MAKLILFFILFITLFPTCYFIFSFVAWEPNPSEWAIGQRALCVIMPLLFSALVAGLPDDY